MRTAQRIFWSFLFVVLSGLVTAGCASTDPEDNAAERPWNRPQGWESGIPGMNQPR